MRVNEGVMALNMKEVLLKNKVVANSLNSKKPSNLTIVKENGDAVELAINNKMKSQIREISYAEGNSRDEETSLNEAITTMQDITGILEEMQEILHTIQNKNFSQDEYNSFDIEFKELQVDFDDLLGREILNPYLLEDGLNKSKNIISSSDLINFDINEIKDLVDLYQDKIKELENINQRFKESTYVKDVGKINLSASESHVQNIATAEEIVDNTKLSIINELSKAMLSQSNKDPKQVINLLES